MLADYHVHSEFSDDSVYPMEQIAADAVALNLDELCFTDHVDYGIKADWDAASEIAYRNEKPLANVDYPRYMEEVQRVRELFADEIALKTGMEFGVQTHTMDQFRALFRRYPFDFVLLSIHQVEDKEFWTQDFQHGRSQKEYNERYYKELYDVVHSFKDYSVIAHLDLIKRYDEIGVYPFEDVRPVVEEILRTAIQDGKGIELNTSAVRYGLEDTMPGLGILRLFRKMGGEVITIGSDSHAPSHLGRYLRQSQRLLASLGYRYFCTFENMQPVFQTLA